MMAFMVLRKRSDWSRPPPYPPFIPTVMTPRTLADARKLMSHLPAATRAEETWQTVAPQLDAYVSVPIGRGRCRWRSPFPRS
jgi:hypothetical protein